MLQVNEICTLLKSCELKKEPVVIRVNSFNEEAASKFVKSICDAHDTGQKVIPVVIDYYGGEVYSLMAMISAIKSAQLPVATIVEGKAMSCGAVLTAFGAEGMRFASPHSTLMIHDVSSVEIGKVNELKAGANEADRLNKLVYEMMAENCGKPSDYFLKIVDQKKHADWFLDAEEAKKHNIVNHLRIPSLRTRVTVDIDFE